MHIRIKVSQNPLFAKIIRNIKLTNHILNELKHFWVYYFYFYKNWV